MRNKIHKIFSSIFWKLKATIPNFETFVEPRKHTSLLLDKSGEPKAKSKPGHGIASSIPQQLSSHGRVHLSGEELEDAATTAGESFLGDRKLNASKRDGTKLSDEFHTDRSTSDESDLGVARAGGSGFKLESSSRIQCDLASNRSSASSQGISQGWPHPVSVESPPFQAARVTSSPGKTSKPDIAEQTVVKDIIVRPPDRTSISQPALGTGRQVPEEILSGEVKAQDNRTAILGVSEQGPPDRSLNDAKQTSKHGDAVKGEVCRFTWGITSKFETRGKPTSSPQLCISGLQDFAVFGINIYDKSLRLSASDTPAPGSTRAWQTGRTESGTSGDYPRVPFKVHLSKRKLASETKSENAEAVATKRLKMAKETAAGSALEADYNRYLQVGPKHREAAVETMTFADYCAHRIQIWWLFKHHKFLKRRFAEHLKATKTGYSELILPLNSTKKKRLEWVAAIRIQRAWRKHIDLQVYRYYRDLINFSTRGDPVVLLRCVNPTEAKLLDSASGASVRFRLAGDKFPPNIYYKIFTQRPIQDLCANSPKDYTRRECKQLPMRHEHNNIVKLPPQHDPNHDHWYKRFENNGWRLVSDRLIHHMRNDPITLETSKKLYSFDHRKLQRKQDVEKLKRSKKIDWMKKMYKEGMLHARANDQQTIQLIEGAAAGMMATVDREGPDALEDWEVDELLDWTTSLNFDQYFNSWKVTATSACADSNLERIRSVQASSTDPYEFMISTTSSRAHSTHQSRNTPQAPSNSSIHIKS